MHLGSGFILESDLQLNVSAKNFEFMNDLTLLSSWIGCNGQVLTFFESEQYSWACVMKNK